MIGNLKSGLNRAANKAIGPMAVKPTACTRAPVRALSSSFAMKPAGPRAQI